MFGRRNKSTPYSRTAARKQIRYLGKPTQKYTKTYTSKEWKRFSPDVQQVLTNRYTVTLSDHATRKEKIHKLGKSIRKAGVTGTLTKIDKGITKFDRGMKSFDMGLREIDRTFTPASKRGKYDLGSLASF